MTSWRHGTQHIRRLDWRSRRLLLASAVLLPLFWTRLKLLGRWDLTSSIEGAIPPSPPPGTVSLEALRHTGRLVNGAARHLLPPHNCLTRSLVLQWLLRRQGVPTDLCLGAQLEGGQLRAHAWVEFDGHPLNDAEDVAERFPPFTRPGIAVWGASDSL